MSRGVRDDIEKMRAREVELADLARDIFLADNSNAPAGMMEKEWDAEPTKFSYAHMIADGLLAAGYGKVQP